MEKPEIAVVALFENGEESYNAVPIVRDVIKAYFDKKAREKGSLNAQLVPFTSPSLLPSRPLALLPLPLRKDLWP